MKAAEIRELTSTSCARARRTSTTSCSGCGSRSRWASSRRRPRCASVRRDLARIKTILREKQQDSERAREGCGKDKT